MSLNQDGAAVDKLSQCFPSLETTGPFCSAPIPRLLLHLPSLCCCFPSAGLFWASSEPALGGSLGSGEVGVLQWSQVCDGWGGLEMLPPAGLS